MRNPFQRIRDFFRNPPMIGTPPSERPMWHDPEAHARDFAERYAEPMNYHVEHRMMELGIPTGSIRAEVRLPAPGFLAGRDDRRGNVPGKRLTVDSGVFNTELMAYRPEANAVWAKSRLRDRIDAVIAHEDAESLTGDHDFAEAMAPNTTLPITDGRGEFFERSGGNPGSGDVIHYLTVGHLDPEALGECAAVAIRPLDETTVRRVLAEFPGIRAEIKDGYVVLPWHGLGRWA